MKTNLETTPITSLLKTGNCSSLKINKIRTLLPLPLNTDTTRPFKKLFKIAKSFSILNKILKKLFGLIVYAMLNLLINSKHVYTHHALNVRKKFLYKSMKTQEIKNIPVQIVSKN